MRVVSAVAAAVAVASLSGCATVSDLLGEAKKAVDGGGPVQVLCEQLTDGIAAQSGSPEFREYLKQRLRDFDTALSVTPADWPGVQRLSAAVASANERISDPNTDLAAVAKDLQAACVPAK